MCGRFALSAPVTVLRRHFAVAEELDLQPRYNIAPGQKIAAIRQGRGGREIVMLRWGLIPSWAKDAGLGSRLIIARSETLEEKPSFRSSFRKYRCLIPADGFYEWKEIPGAQAKKPYFITRRDRVLFAMAGQWSTWKNKETGEIIESCTIITTDANPLLREIHPRMPAILPQDRYDAWLNAQTGAGELKILLRPLEEAAMLAYPVSGLCNNPKNDTPECIQEAP